MLTIDTILNLLPLTPEEQDLFRAAAPDAVHHFAPAPNLHYAAEGGTPEQYAAATIILGCPPSEPLSGAVALKWLQAWSAGVDSYLLPGVLRPGAALTCSAGAYGVPVSEHMLGMLLSLCKHLPRYRDLQRAAQWKDLGLAKLVSGSTVLIGGVGDLGSSFALRVKALGARTIGLRRDSARPAPGIDEMYPLSALDALLPQADVVALALPHTPETAGLMDARRLALMKEDAILLNAGRGSAVHVDALASALAAGHLWGAGLDVTAPEPLPPSHPLWAMDNVILTSHAASGGLLEPVRALVVRMALENLRRYLASEPLLNRMN